MSINHTIGLILLLYLLSLMNIAHLIYLCYSISSAIKEGNLVFFGYKKTLKSIYNAIDYMDKRNELSFHKHDLFCTVVGKIPLMIDYKINEICIIYIDSAQIYINGVYIIMLNPISYYRYLILLFKINKKSVSKSKLSKKDIHDMLLKGEYGI